MEDKDSSSGNGLGYFLGSVGIAGIVATFMLGPIDLARSVYNGIIGDTPVLKEQLLDYIRRDIRRKNLGENPEKDLANKIGVYNLDSNGRIDPQKVSVEKLWDAAEDHARSEYQRWIWTSLDDN